MLKTPTTVSIIERGSMMKSRWGANTPHHILPDEGRKYTTERWRKRRR